MSNICPQLPDFNRIGWKNIEAKVRSLLNKQDSLIVYTGPVLNGKDLSNYIVTIDSIEAIIGIDLYPGLSELIENRY